MIHFQDASHFKLIIFVSLWSPAGCALVWSPWYWKDPLSQSCSPSHWLYLHQSVWLWTGPEVYWRGWVSPSVTQIRFLSELMYNSLHSFLFLQVLAWCASCLWWLENTRHQSSSWTRLTPSGPPVWRAAQVATVRCREQCWNFSISWMDLKPPRTSRYHKQQNNTLIREVLFSLCSIRLECLSEQKIVYLLKNVI